MDQPNPHQSDSESNDQTGGAPQQPTQQPQPYAPPTQAPYGPYGQPPQTYAPPQYAPPTSQPYPAPASAQQQTQWAPPQQQQPAYPSQPSYQQQYQTHPAAPTGPAYPGAPGAPTAPGGPGATAARRHSPARTVLITLTAVIAVFAIVFTYFFFAERPSGGRVSDDMSVYGDNFDTSKYDLQKPILDVDSTYTFREKVGSVASRLDSYWSMSGYGATQDGDLVAGVYADPAFKNQMNVSVAQDEKDPDTITITANQGLVLVNYFDPNTQQLHAESFDTIKANKYYFNEEPVEAGDLDHYFDTKQHAYARFTGFGSYYLVVYYGEDGQKLAKPKVTYFTVKDDKHQLATPQNLQARVDDQGHVNVSWDPVEGATHYKVYLRVGGAVLGENATDAEKQKDDLGLQSTYILAAPTGTSVNLKDWDPSAAPEFKDFLKGMISQYTADRKVSTFAKTPYYQNLQFINLYDQESEDEQYDPDTNLSLEENHNKYQRNASNVQLYVIAYGDNEVTTNSPIATININPLLSQIPIAPAFNAITDGNRAGKKYVSYITVADGLTRIVPKEFDWSTAQTDGGGVKVSYYLGATAMHSTETFSDKGTNVNDVKTRVEQESSELQKSDTQAGLAEPEGQVGTVEWNDSTGDVGGDVDLNSANGSVEFVKFVAANLLQERTTMEITKYVKEAGAPTVSDVLDEALAQNPLILHSHAYSGVKQEGSRTFLKVEYYDNSYGDDTANVRQQLSQKADQIVSQIVKPGMDDRAKATAINDYLVRTFAYDYPTYESELKGGKSVDQSFYTRHKSNQNASGLLGSYNGEDLTKTVCAGYARSFKLLADKAGLNSIYVSGTVNASTQNARHAWNQVKIGDQWLTEDATWNDTGGGSSDQYLLVSPSSSAIKKRSQVIDNAAIVDAYLSAYGLD
ncbi:transglutaminase domain-containing protein [Bifidobacterium avesanii]|uniref:Transglutaminase-like domain-containing protein n=1 Tax=Bifidobacterium avesanii TaxID=1798157 RepID=A0A7K3THY6_9BIFI|nr:transglutaminase domain-containing protein [Bifidobacterium avesanii]KAB8291975.1 hypothetical protein DSM100685_0987 [Bifidobacterium avesanii]NEG78662.1 hypothetical protein [Bifidobacterium avesanii]